MSRAREILGMKFNRLLVIKRAENNKHSQARWICLCDCGNTTNVLSTHLVKSRIKSCGCLITEVSRERGRASATHGKTKTPEYRTWSGMRKRCSKKKRYINLGISVCDRWESFENFLEDMGPRPSPRHSLDRHPNQLGNYEPSNCRWATAGQQANNRISNRTVLYRGEKMNLSDAVALAGNVVLPDTCFSRLESGWDIDAAIETPTKSRGGPRSIRPSAPRKPWVEGRAEG